MRLPLLLVVAAMLAAPGEPAAAQIPTQAKASAAEAASGDKTEQQKREEAGAWDIFVGRWLADTRECASFHFPWRISRLGDGLSVALGTPNNGEIVYRELEATSPPTVRSGDNMMTMDEERIHATKSDGSSCFAQRQ